MKQTVVLCVDYYKPGFRGGGPGRAIEQIVKILGDQFVFTLLTRDHDLGEQELYPESAMSEVRADFPGTIHYINKRRRLTSIWRILGDTERSALYLNSFFSLKFSILPILVWKLQRKKGKVGIAPRGEFSGGALKLKRLKKRLFLKLARLSRIYRGVIWSASSEYEADDIRSVIDKNAKIVITPEISVSDKDLDVKKYKKGGTLKIIFISRITKKKNLTGALAILRGSGRSIEFDIYGPIEDKMYWNECVDLIGSMPNQINCRYQGVVLPEDVQATFNRYDLFLFPTLGENYGHVIAESLFAGVPVLISNATPWRGLERLCLGWDYALSDLDGFIGAVEKCCDKPMEDYVEWRVKIREWALDNIGKRCDVKGNKDFFEELFNA